MEQTIPESHYLVDLDSYPPSDFDPTTAPVQSKSAQKKALKAERYAAQKLSRRAREKEAKKEKKRLLAERRELGEHPECQRNWRKRTRIDGKSFGGRVIVDLAFDNMMSDKVGHVISILPSIPEFIPLCRKSHHCVRNWLTLTAPIVVRHSHSL